MKWFFPDSELLVNRLNFFVVVVALANMGSHTFRPIRGKNGHKGRVLVEFAPSCQAWADANTLHKQCKMNARGYTEWLGVKPRWRQMGPSNINDGTAFVAWMEQGIQNGYYTSILLSQGTCWYSTPHANMLRIGNSYLDCSKIRSELVVVVSDDESNRLR